MESASGRRRPGPPVGRSRREKGPGQSAQPLPPLRVARSRPGQRQAGRHPCGHREDHGEEPDVALRRGGPHQSDGERKGRGVDEGPQRRPEAPRPSPRRTPGVVSRGAAGGRHLRSARQARPRPGTLRRSDPGRGAQPGGRPPGRGNLDRAAQVRRGRQAHADDGGEAVAVESGTGKERHRTLAAAARFRPRRSAAEQGEVEGVRREELAGPALAGGSAGDPRPAPQKRRPQRRSRRELRRSGEGVPPRVGLEPRGRGNLDLLRAVLRQRRSDRQGEGRRRRGVGKNFREGGPRRLGAVLRDPPRLGAIAEEDRRSGRGQREGAEGVCGGAGGRSRRSADRSPRRRFPLALPRPCRRRAAAEETRLRHWQSRGGRRHLGAAAPGHGAGVHGRIRQPADGVEDGRRESRRPRGRRAGPAGPPPEGVLPGDRPQPDAAVAGDRRDGIAPPARGIDLAGRPFRVGEAVPGLGEHAQVPRAHAHPVGQGGAGQGENRPSTPSTTSRPSWPTTKPTKRSCG